MQTLFTHVAKIGADYIVCDPTVPCPSPTPPIPPFIGGGGGPLYDRYDERFDGPCDNEASLLETRVHAYKMDVVCTIPMSQIIVKAETMDGKVSAKVVLVSVKAEVDDGSD